MSTGQPATTSHVPSFASHHGQPPLLPTPTTATTRTTTAVTSIALQAHSPLLTLPQELFVLVALHLGTRPPNLGPPAALLPLLLTCRSAHARLGVTFGDNGNCKGNQGLWARIARAKFALGDTFFDLCPPSLKLELGPRGSSNGKDRERSSRDVRALRAVCASLRVLRTGDPHHLAAGVALQLAYALLVADDGKPAALEESGWVRYRAYMDSVSGTSGAQGEGRDGGANGDEGGLGRAGRNKRHLAWAGARTFALRYVQTRLWEGRYGENEREPASNFARQANSVDEWREEWSTSAWRVGWPRDTRTGAAALWVMWFFEGKETLTAEPDALRQSIMAQLLPFVVAPFRYASALAPPHHYTVPFLPGVRGLLGNTERITVPTFHGAYPIYACADGEPVAAVPPPPPPLAEPRDHRRKMKTRHRKSSSPSLSPSPSPSSSSFRSASTLRKPRHKPQPFLAPYKRPSLGRLLSAPPARLLFFARFQAGARMGVPPHLPLTRAEALQRWDAHLAQIRAEGGDTRGMAMEIRPTQADLHEKNGRAMVRFEVQVPVEEYAVDPSHAFVTDPYTKQGEDEVDGGAKRRWVHHRWRGRLCGGYEPSLVLASTPSAATSSSSLPLHRPTGGEGRPGRGGSGAGNPWQGIGGAPPGRIGRVYELGSMAGFWAGTMIMPSGHVYMAIVNTPGGALPPGGLAREDFVATPRPVYMRIKEHWSFHPQTPAPPPAADSVTGDEGLRHAWLPSNTRVVSVGGGQVEVRVPASALSEREDVHVYETVLEDGRRVREGAHDIESCPGCVRAAECGRKRRARQTFDEGESVSGEEDAMPPPPLPASLSPPLTSASSFSSSESESELGSDSGSDAEADPATWAEWARFPSGRGDDGTEGWEGACDGVQDVVFTGETDLAHGQAWHRYEFAGRVRPWDGLIGLVMRPYDLTLGLETYFISGHLVGGDTFEGTWQWASHDVLAPSWGGSICLARGEE